MWMPMNLYSRLIAALAIAATIGATCLALMMLLTTGPFITWAVLVGTLTAGAVVLARWALHPLQQLATELGDGSPPDIHDILGAIRKGYQAAQNRADGTDQTLVNDFAKRASQWHQGNQALSLLFSSVTRDRLNTDHQTFFESLLADWTREGLVDAAAILWSDDTPAHLHSRGTITALPESLTTSQHRLTQPALEQIDDRTWARFPVAMAQPPEGDTPYPIAVLVTWPEAAPPSEQTLAGWTAVTRYMGLRIQALDGVIMTTAPNADADTLALQAGFLADANGRLQQSMAAMGELISLIGEHLDDNAAKGAVADALLERGQALLERLSGLLDLTSGSWCPTASLPQPVNVATLVERAIEAHRNHPTATLNVRTNVGTDTVNTDATALSLALETLVQEMLQRHPGNINVTTRQQSDDGHLHCEFIVESDNPDPAPNTSSLGLALVTQLAKARGGTITQSHNEFSHRIKLRWPYTPNPFSQHGKAA
jgi:hypothetical protein